MAIDFRSDTVTRPTPPMLRAMMEAEVGDDVFGEDPSINRLESMAAGLFGMEAALYCPSGTMSNQIGIKCHTQPGDEVICEKSSHVYIYEGGGIAFNSGSQVRAVDGDRGRITAEQVMASINPDDVHRARTSLVCLENTCNRGGGSCYDAAQIEEIRMVCLQNGLRLHLDGARLFNALVARNEDAPWYGRTFDSISVCLNKGLGCPIGSILMGTAAYIRQARRVRKVFGGGMRQAGFMAAAGIYALQHNLSRLAEDHLHAKQIAAALENKPFVSRIMPVETNIVIADIDASHDPKQIAAALRDKGILVIAISPTQIRFVTHLDISPEMVGTAIRVIEKL
ncbi:MAG: GntG family PLP-dependent aldolase [Bacteroidota bacterium]|nr:GntG family PLP-dependent aldolase [Bacteroidota bacterium]MDP4245073.1 GntG family PLP-dependent aldolase [Bacteroidota bacterium]MDP4256449.1 GntG family PLP-dependent aldolase [Bacteroidota bacterium]